MRGERPGVPLCRFGPGAGYYHDYTPAPGSDTDESKLERYLNDDDGPRPGRPGSSVAFVAIAAVLAVPALVVAAWYFGAGYAFFGALALGGVLQAMNRADRAGRRAMPMTETYNACKKPAVLGPGGSAPTSPGRQYRGSPSGFLDRPA